MRTRPRVPEETGVDHWEPLLVSADRIAASFADTRGGTGRTFFLDLDSGETVSVPPPPPRVAFSLDNEVLVFRTPLGPLAKAPGRAVEGISGAIRCRAETLRRTTAGEGRATAR